MTKSNVGYTPNNRGLRCARERTPLDAAAWKAWRRVFKPLLVEMLTQDPEAVPVKYRKSDKKGNLNRIATANAYYADAFDDETCDVSDLWTSFSGGRLSVSKTKKTDTRMMEQLENISDYYSRALRSGCVYWKMPTAPSPYFKKRFHAWLGDLGKSVDVDVGVAVALANID